jgi:thermitase
LLFRIISTGSLKSFSAQKSLKALGVQADLKTSIPQLNMAVVKGNFSSADSIAKALGSDVEYVVKNGSVRLDSVKKDKWESEAGILWGMDAIKLKDAWPITRGSKDVILAISDTGTRFDHFDIQDNLWINKGEVGTDANGKDKSKNKVDDDGNGYVDDVYGYNFETNNGYPLDNHYHGTHVAGTIGGVGGNGGIVGVSGIVSLMTVKFIGQDGSGTDDHAIQSIVYAVDNGAKAINCSWGSDEYTQPLYDAIAYAQKKGVLLIAAAGNDGEDHDKHLHYPSGYDLDNIISVAATYEKNGRLAGFSNYGLKTVDIAAPGDTIYSSFNPMYQTLYCGSGGTSHFYCELSGTSMATPHVTGTVGLIYAVNPKLTYSQVRDIILSTAAPSKYLTGKVVTGGQLDAAAAVKKAAATLN